MADQVSGEPEAPALNHTAYLEAEDAMSAKVALASNELCGRGWPRIIGTSAALQSVLGMVRVVARTDSTVLINGGTGTGKELIAEAIHKCIHRSKVPFVKVHCASLPAVVLEGARCSAHTYPSAGPCA